MKVVIISQSDSVGGAAVVSHRLLKALQAQGVEASMLAMHAQAHRGDADVVEYGSSWRGKFYFLAERLGIFLRNGFNRSNLFKVSTASWGFDLSRHPLVQDADAVIVNWINQGAMSLNGLQALAATGKPLLWVMHDLWCCTGICHHPYSCNSFIGECKSCPFLNSKGSDLSTHIQRLKKSIYSSSGIHFIAVSSWVENRCRQSSLLRNARITTIPNAFPVTQCNWHCDQQMRASLGIAPSTCVVIMGAARLDDPVKGFDRAIEVLNRFKGKDVHALFFGAIRNPELLNRIVIPHTHVGMIPPSHTAAYYRAADVVISTSHYETAGATLAEGLSYGCLPVSFDAGGQSDMISHRENGWLAPAGDINALAQGIEWAMTHPVTRQELHQSAIERCDSTVVARRFISLLNAE